MAKKITVVGPNELKIKDIKRQAIFVDVTSRSKEGLLRRLSPYKLGPVSTYRGRCCRLLENAWRYSHVYREHLDKDGNIDFSKYFKWALSGWCKEGVPENPTPSEKENSKERPVFYFWNDKRMDYIEARTEICVSLYMKSVVDTQGFRYLQEQYNSGNPLLLFDFNGYDEEKLGMSIEDIVNCKSRKLSHAFLLKYLLLAQ